MQKESGVLMRALHDYNAFLSYEKGSGEKDAEKTKFQRSEVCHKFVKIGD